MNIDSTIFLQVKKSLKQGIWSIQKASKGQMMTKVWLNYPSTFTWVANHSKILHPRMLHQINLIHIFAFMTNPDPQTQH